MNWSKVFVIVCSFASLLVFPKNFTATPSLLDSDIGPFIDSLIEEKMEEFHIPNATVSVVHDGEVILTKGYGYADLEEDKHVDPDFHMFRVGSVSKLFTWTAVMQLVEQGKLDLHDDINEYLDFTIPSTLEINGKTEVEQLTLYHLMTHTPGFEDYVDSIFTLSEERMLPLHEYIRIRMPARIFPPGEVIAYSNYGTALAGYIVEQVSGMPFPEYVEKHIFQPLGMKQSTFQQPLPGKISSDMTQAYRLIDGEYKKAEFEFMPGPAGGMSSTASDMAQFMIAYLNGGENAHGRILEEQTVQEIFDQQFTLHSQIDGMTLGFMEKTINNERFLFHAGSTMLFDTGFYLLPEKNIGLFISYSGGNYLAHSDVFQTFMDTYFPAEQTDDLVGLPDSLERSKKFVGEYHQNRKSFTTSESILSLVTGVIKVDVNESGDLLVTHVGETNTFVETEEGIYRNTRQGATPDPYGEFRTIVFKTDPLGNVMLVVDGPMTYSKAPWFRTSTFTFLSIILTVVLFTGSLIYWGVAAIFRIIKHKKVQHSKSEKLARGIAVLFGVLTLGWIGSVVVTSELDPVYGLPKSAFGDLPAWISILDLLPYAVCLLGIGLIFFSVFIWRKGYWRLPSRIHYTILTVSALHLIWIFWLWNVI